MTYVPGSTESAELARITRLLAHLRVREGLTKIELARRIGAHPNTIGRIEREAKAPTLPILLAWLRACGCTLDVVRFRAEQLELVVVDPTADPSLTHRRVMRQNPRPKTAD